MPRDIRAAEAKQRKEEKKRSEEEEKQKKADEIKWKETDKHLLAKEQRKNEAEIRAEEVRKKKEKLKLLEKEENEQIKSKSTKQKEAPKKVTRAEIEARRVMALRIESEKKKTEAEKYIDGILEYNPNRVVSDERELAEAAGQEYLAAQSITEALEGFSVGGPEAVNIQQIRKAFLEEKIAELRQDFPSLKHSQLKEKAYKEWLRSPQNPNNSKQY
eukprot:GHVP01029102.1.p1 GENE.GHVP01029102.1~~GHVP01029102.1.p1  ORF type:complete len:216 (+),score=72.18 GHVP01029102.1:21-668(+)